MTKTIREWLNELPEKERTKAFNNVIPDMLGARYDSMYLALMYAFEWRSTKEAYEYWHKVANRYK